MSDAHQGNADDLAARLGRLSARAVKQAKPRLKRLAGDAKPLANKAAQYAAEHQDEIRDAGTRLLRSRLRGPLGMAFDAVAGAVPPAKDAAKPGSCPKCGAGNPASARFCNQCAAPMNNG
jgi:hypothetical protein